MLRTSGGRVQSPKSTNRPCTLPSSPDIQAPSAAIDVNPTTALAFTYSLQSPSDIPTWPEAWSIGSHSESNVAPSTDCSIQAHDSSPTSGPSHSSFPSMPPRPMQTSAADAISDVTTLASAHHDTNPSECLISTPLNPLDSSIGRDALLTYARRLYDLPRDPVTIGVSPVPLFASTPTITFTDYTDQLFQLLMILRALHPGHLPTLLLLGSVYHASGDIHSSLAINQEILDIDPHYVEAMCNIGTAMNSLSRNEEAREWWWKALVLQPMYWDVMDDLLNNVLASSIVELDSTPRCIALDICRFVQSSLVDQDGSVLAEIPPHQLYRLQGTYSVSGNLLTLQKRPVEEALGDYIRAIELSIRPLRALPAERYTFVDLVIASHLASLLISSNSIPTNVARALGFVDGHEFLCYARTPGFTLMHVIHAAGERLIDTLQQDGALPPVLLEPSHVMLLTAVLFSTTSGVLPCICTRKDANIAIQLPQDDVRITTNSTTSTILMTLAKRLQDVSSTSSPLPSTTLSLRISTSLIVLLHYLAVSLSPTASAYNNLGVAISSLSSASRGALTAKQIAKAYYEEGLRLDPNHPHLLTNLGSLEKDQGHTALAIQLYMRAIQIQPDFDIALMNLANSIRDLGRPWDAVGYYRRALILKDSPEAVCGLANSLNAICDWRGRGALESGFHIDIQGRLVGPGRPQATQSPGWMCKMITSCEQQLRAAYSRSVGLVRSVRTFDQWLGLVQTAYDRTLTPDELKRWVSVLQVFYTDVDRAVARINESGFLIRLIEWLHRRMQRISFLKMYGYAYRADIAAVSPSDATGFERILIPSSTDTLHLPSVLPFHCFTYPLQPHIIRAISHRNALRISYTTLTAPWLPRHIYLAPPPPFQDRLNIGYVSHDFNNHPLAHLMQSVFGCHNRNRFNIHLYATSPSDGSSYRQKIETESQHFVDVSSWAVSSIVDRIVEDQIHILVNLGGYTKGTQNEIFAARPCPIQILLMGFAGTLAAGWCDYLVCDQVSCPPDLRPGKLSSELFDSGLYVGNEADPESLSDDWIYTEKLIHMPHTYLVTDHKQSYPDVGRTFDEAETQRAELRREIFPDLPEDMFIFANFNQMYKIDPEIFRAWLRILDRVPNSVLWLLRFPPAGEEHLMRTAKAWAGESVAARIRFTDVATKDSHIQRCSVADLFLDTAECSAHTVAADVLWSGTPILTWPKYRYKMCSRVGASVANATGLASRMVVSNLQEYEDRATSLATSGVNNRGELRDLRRSLHNNKNHMPLFDTPRWTKNLEKGYREAWRRWVSGKEFEDEQGCVWIQDNEPVTLI